jgi:hypothetical protein
MGVTMFIQQRMMPSTADPMQQKIFMLMPVIFTVMFLTVPSGLRDLLAGQQTSSRLASSITNCITGGPPTLKPATALRKG